MNSLILLTSHACRWSPENWAIDHGGKSGADGQVVVELPTGWLSVLCEDRIWIDYEEGEQAAIRSILGKPALFLIEWKGDHLLRKLLQSIPADERVLVDNDHGLIVPTQAVNDLEIGSWIRSSGLLGIG